MKQSADEGLKRVSAGKVSSPKAAAPVTSESGTAYLDIRHAGDKEVARFGKQALRPDNIRADIPRDDTGYISPYRAKLKALARRGNEADSGTRPYLGRGSATIEATRRMNAAPARAQLAEIHSRVMQNRKKK